MWLWGLGAAGGEHRTAGRSSAMRGGRHGICHTTETDAIDLG
eukprot:SAG31_NODE_45407_length_259_cov_0.631250_1_plen_41_part_10